MDRLKFRVWDKVDEKFMHTEYLKDLCITADGVLWLMTGLHFTKLDDDRYVVLQSTELKDIHDKLIYEGDIVIYQVDYTENCINFCETLDIYDNDIREHTEVVQFDNGCFTVNGQPIYNFIESLEVIGNKSLKMMCNRKGNEN